MELDSNNLSLSCKLRDDDYGKAFHARLVEQKSAIIRGKESKCKLSTYQEID